MLGFLNALLFAGKCIKEACEPVLPAEYHGNRELENHDADEVRMGRMTKREFLRNMDNGKYYKAPDYNGWSRYESRLKRILDYYTEHPENPLSKHYIKKVTSFINDFREIKADNMRRGRAFETTKVPHTWAWHLEMMEEDMKEKEEDQNIQPPEK